MQRFLILLIGASAAAMFAGCATTDPNVSQVPLPMGYPKVWQRKMQAAYHWSELADYQSGLILTAIKDRTKAIYINPTTESGVTCEGDECTPFAQAYHDMLQSYLVKKGGVMVTDPGTATVFVTYVAQALEHKDRSYGIWEPQTLGVSSKYPAADLQTWSYKSVDPTEVIITTKVTEGRLILHSGTDIFYYNRGDTDHYSNKHPIYKNVTIKVVDRSGGPS